MPFTRMDGGRIIPPNLGLVKMFRQLSKRAILSQALDLSGCGMALRAASVWQGVLILNYHRIGEHRHSELDRNLWSASCDDFDMQVSTAKRNFDVIGLDDVQEALASRSGRFVMFTFDDGYRDNYTEAYRILKSHAVPATFFVTTGFLDDNRVPWWDDIAWMVRRSPLTALAASRFTNGPVPFDNPDREEAIRRLLSVYKSLPGEVTEDYVEFLADALQTGRCPESIGNELWMTWDMVREMRSGGMSFGGHTVNHPILANQSSEQQDWEVGECKRRLEEELKEPITSLSYPVGGRSSFNAFTRAALTNHGYKMAFSYFGGFCRFGHQDQFAISRTAIETDIDHSLFRAVVTLPQVFA